MKQFEIIEKAGVSNESYSDAVKNALESVKKDIYWFEVVDHRGRMTTDKKVEFQVVIKIGCN